MLVAVVLLTLAACGSGKPSASSATTSGLVTPTGGAGETSTTDLPFTGSAAPVATPDSATPATLVHVDIGVHDGFERIVFRFADHVPGIRIQPSPGPFAEDGSDKPVHVGGTAWLALRMTANGHDSYGTSAVAMRTKGAKGHSVVELVRTGDLEGVLSFVIGLEAPQTFRVLQVGNPPRIVVDIASR